MSGYREALLHTYITWNDRDFDKPIKVKVIAEVNYYNNDKAYLYIHNFEHNAKVYKESSDYIELLGDEE